MTYGPKIAVDGKSHRWKSNTPSARKWLLYVDAYRWKGGWCCTIHWWRRRYSFGCHNWSDIHKFRRCIFKFDPLAFYWRCRRIFRTCAGMDKPRGNGKRS